MFIFCINVNVTVSIYLTLSGDRCAKKRSSHAQFLALYSIKCSQDLIKDTELELTL